MLMCYLKKKHFEMYAYKQVSGCLNECSVLRDRCYPVIFGVY